MLSAVFGAEIQRWIARYSACGKIREFAVGVLREKDVVMGEIAACGRGGKAVDPRRE
jgi:hypothetical protein